MAKHGLYELVMPQHYLCFDNDGNTLAASAAHAKLVANKPWHQRTLDRCSRTFGSLFILPPVPAPAFIASKVVVATATPSTATATPPPMQWHQAETNSSSSTATATTAVASALLTSTLYPHHLPAETLSLITSPVVSEAAAATVTYLNWAALHHRHHHYHHEPPDAQRRLRLHLRLQLHRCRRTTTTTR